MTDSPLDELPSAVRSAVMAIIETARNAASDAIEIVLLGSHARGDADPDSDLDLLVVTDFPPGVDRRGRLGLPRPAPPPQEGVRVDLFCLTPRELEAILIANSIEWQVITQALPRAVVLHAFAEGVPIGECPHFCEVRESYREEVRAGRLPEIRPPVRVPTLEMMGIPNVVGLIDRTRELTIGHGHLQNNGRRKCAKVSDCGPSLHSPWSQRRTYEVIVHLASPWRTRLPPFGFVGNLGTAFGDRPAWPRYTEVRATPLLEFVAETPKWKRTEVPVSRAGLEQVVEELRALLALDDLPTDLQVYSRLRSALFTEREDRDRLHKSQLEAFSDQQRIQAEAERTVPFLLLNGTIGLPGARATYLPHDLQGIADALLALVDDPSTTDDTILDRVGLPDFPTGGVLPDPEGARAAQRDGAGIVRWEPTVSVRGSGDDRVLVLSGIPIDVTIRTIILELEVLRDAGTLAARSIEGIAHGSHASIEVHLAAEADANAVARAAIDGSSLSWEIEVDMTALDGGTEFRAGVPFWVRKHYEARRAFHPNEASLRAEFRELRALGDARRTVCATD